MEHRGFTCTPKLDEIRNVFHGELRTNQGVLLLSAASAEELQQKFRRTVDSYLAFFDEKPLRPLPTIRTKILAGYCWVIIVSALLCGALLSAVYSASEMPVRLTRRNYDSLAYAARMREAWYQLQLPEMSKNESRDKIVARFEEQLKRAESNITEPGEAEILHALREGWQRSLGASDVKSFAAVLSQLDNLVALNEKGMFSYIHQAAELWNVVAWRTGLASLVIIFLAVLLSFRSASRVTRSLRAIAQALYTSDGDARVTLREVNPESEEVRLVMEALNLRFLREEIAEEGSFEQLPDSALSLPRQH